MKNKIDSCSTSLHLHGLLRLFIFIFSVFLLAPGLLLKVKAEVGNTPRFPLPNALVLQEQKVVPSDGGTDSYFGRAVAINGSTTLIGAIGDNGFQGAAYLFTKSNGVWSEGQKLTASDGSPGDRFGSSVTLADDILFVGAPDATVNGTSGQGAVYVFRKSGNTWIESQKLIASDGAETDAFGAAIALSGRTLVVGAPNDSIGSESFQGSAYVFVQINGIWRPAQKLTGDDSVGFDHFGSAVAAHGSIILVGAPSKNILAGEVYVFSRVANSWNQTQSLLGNDTATFDQFGASLALGSATALVGAPENGGQGAAYVFAISGGTLTEIQKLTSSDPPGLDEFGSTVALVENQGGHRALVGAPSATVGQNSQQGKAYVFREMGGNWDPVGRIIASDGQEADFFPFAVALDRDTAVLGVTPATLPHEGAAYFYSAPAGVMP